jgi:diadenosine tetraphosphatase ApaH/serine/threonine PP2A family protein phosphatase
VKYVIISDIHANLEAFEAARKEIGKISPDKILCLGDLVGYGASPNECVEAAREISDLTVAGNHDFGAVGRTDIAYFNMYAREAILWTARALKQDNFDFLCGRPLTEIVDDKIRIVHATPRDPERWNYIFSHEQALEEFDAFAEQVCFIGHSHQPIIYEMMDRETLIVNNDRVKVRDGRRYLVNVGSVGQPRDGNPKAAICVYDLDESEITIKRVEYDVEEAKKRITEAGLPAVLANRLSWGE